MRSENYVWSDGYANSFTCHQRCKEALKAPRMIHCSQVVRIPHGSNFQLWCAIYWQRVTTAAPDYLLILIDVKLPPIT